MKSVKLFVASIFAAIFVMSCNDEIAELSESNRIEDKRANTNYRVSIDEAKETLSQFMEMMNGVDLRVSGSNSSISHDYSIRNVEVISSNNHLVYTRAGNTSKGIDTLMYIVNFEDNKGFALVAADKRTDPIYAIIDEGNFSMDSIDKVDNPGFMLCVERSLKKAAYDIKNYSVTNNGKMISTSTPGWGGGNPGRKVYPLLSVKWSQSSPYNNCSPYVDGIQTSNGRGYTGCVITATAQIISYFRCVGQITYNTNQGNDLNSNHGTATLNWDRIIADSKSIANDKRYGTLDKDLHHESSYEVARLMRYLGVALKADYSNKGTGAKSEKAIDWLNDWGGLSASGLSDYNGEETVKALDAKKLVYVRANATKSHTWIFFNKYSDGHAWVIDGYIENMTNGNLDRRLVHCNFGWGGQCDGYYIDGIFDTGEGTFTWELEDENDPRNPYTRPDKDKKTRDKLFFRYKVKMSVIGR